MFNFFGDFLIASEYKSLYCFKKYHSIFKEKMHTCIHIAILTREPNDVLTAFGDNPSDANKALNLCIRVIRGRSSATTTHVRKEDKLTCFA